VDLGGDKRELVASPMHPPWSAMASCTLSPEPRASTSWPTSPSSNKLAHNELDDRSTFNASPIVADGKLFLRSDKYLYCIGK
jgi:hypothetical protein